jgi:hypothetical protein
MMEQLIVMMAAPLMRINSSQECVVATLLIQTEIMTALQTAMMVVPVM